MLSTSAPGSLMLMGEHAVLGGRPALVVAHHHRVQVSLAGGGQRFEAVSDLYGAFDLEAPEAPPCFAFVKAAFDVCRSTFSTPFTLRIASTCPDKLGFGSSAAVTVALLGAFWALQHPGRTPSPQDMYSMWQQAVSVIQKVQGLGSGADAAASLWGGVVLLEPRESRIRRVVDTLPLVAVYSGAKRKTAEVVREFRERFCPLLSVQEALFDASQALVLSTVEALERGDLRQVGQLANMAQGLMEAYGVNTPVLQGLVDKLRRQNCYGAKISGSGSGDCVIGIGSTKEEGGALGRFFAPYAVYPLQVAAEGLVFESA